MSKKIDERLPKEVGSGLYPVKSPWDKMISYREAAHYCQRYTNVVSAAIMQAFRLLEPDYAVRSQAMCTNAYNRLYYVNTMIPGYGEMNAEQLHMHPFMLGNIVGGLVGDAGDEDLLMCGRVNDFGTYRVERSLMFAIGIWWSLSCAGPLPSLSRLAPTVPPNSVLMAPIWNTIWWKPREPVTATAES